MTPLVPPAGGVLDSLGIANAVRSLPEQMHRAVEEATSVDGLPNGDGIDSVVVMGMGGSGISGDVVSLVASGSGSVPVSTCRHYDAPAWMGPSTLAVAVSFSGDTEETLSATEQAIASGAPTVAVTRGGALADLVTGAGGAVCGIPDGIPVPRAGLGAVGVAPLVLLARIGLIADPSEAIAAAADAVAERLTWEEEHGEAEELARRIERTFPIVYGGGRVGEVAATRWKSEINENAKAPATAGTVPELCHNEICAWGQHGDVTRQVFTMVYLRHGGEHPQVARRFEFLRSVTDEVVADIFEVEARGHGPLADFFELATVGSLVSLGLADVAGVDPGPIAAIDDLKRFLAGPA